MLYICQVINDLINIIMQWWPWWPPSSLYSVSSLGFLLSGRTSGVSPVIFVIIAIIVHCIDTLLNPWLHRSHNGKAAIRHEQFITGSHRSWNCGVLAPRPIEHSNIGEVWPRAVCSAAPENRNMCKNASSFRQNCFIKPKLRRKCRQFRWQGGEI